MNGEWHVTDISHQENQQLTDRQQEILEEILPSEIEDAVLIDLGHLKSLEAQLVSTNAINKDMGQSKSNPQSPPESPKVPPELPSSSEPGYVLPNSVENVQQNTETPKPRTKPVFTVQHCRKMVGIKVHNQKPQEKIGIKPLSPTPSTPQKSGIEERDVPSPKGKGALCHYCGYVSSLMNRCQRCNRRLLGSVKVVDVSSSFTSLPSSQPPASQPSAAAAAPVNKDQFYGNSYSRKPRAVRQTRPKFEEPQCVTLSSSEDEADLPAVTATSVEPEAKKSRTEEESSCLTPKIKEMFVLRTYQRKPRDRPSSPEGTEGPTPEESAEQIPEQTDEKAQDLMKWKEVGLKGSFFAVTCRSARIGSYKVAPTDRVLFSPEGIMIEVPVLNADGRPSSKETAKLALSKTQILKLSVHFGKNVPAMFLHLTPMACRNVRDSLRMTNNVPGVWFDSLSPDETHKMLTLLPDNLTDEAKYGIKQAFSVMGVYEEINSTQANQILVRSSPTEVRKMVETAANKENGRVEIGRVEVSRVETSRIETSRITRSSSRNPSKSAPAPVPVVPLFSWSDGADRFSVTTEDYACLNEDRLLNDSIIDFYLRYVFSAKTDPETRSRCHVFSSFFYQRLTTRPPKVSGRKHPVEDDPKLSAAEKRHARVKSWTKKVDIFDKDFLFVPINEHSHWFLAIVCFPGLTGPVSALDGRPVQLPRPPPSVKSETKSPKVQRIPLNKLVTSSGQSYTIGSTTITPVSNLPKGGKVNLIPVTLTTDESSNDKDEAESDDDLTTCDEPASDSAASADATATAPSEKEPIKQPCILLFDSLAGSSRSRVVNTLRDYLQIEYQTKRPEEAAAKPLDKSAVKGHCLDVPQQNNYSDCGIYVLQYAQSFMEKPFGNYRFPMVNMKNWFPAELAARKRMEIQELLLQLTRQLRPETEAEPLVNMLKPVKKAANLRTEDGDPPRTESIPPPAAAQPGTIVVSMETDPVPSKPEAPLRLAKVVAKPDVITSSEEMAADAD